MNKFLGKYSNQEIESMICTSRWKHNGIKCTHFEHGEKRCRKCNVFYKLIWFQNYCMICGCRLAINSSYRKKNHNAID